MIIDTLNTFHWKRELSGNVSSDVVVTSGDADPNLWLVVRVDKALTGTALINVYTSDTENIANPVLLHGITYQPMHQLDTNIKYAWQMVLNVIHVLMSTMQRLVRFLYS